MPKSDGGIQKLCIPTVIERIIQQAMTQQLISICEPKFWISSGAEAKDAVQKIKEYAEQGYTRAVVLELSKYFDTLNHELLVNILRRDVKDERVFR